MEVKTGIKELQKTWNLVNNPVQNSARPNQITHQNRTCSICCRIWSMLKDVIHSAWLLYWHLEWTMLSQVWLKGSKSSLTDVELRKLRHFGRVEPFHMVEWFFFTAWICSVGCVVWLVKRFWACFMWKCAQTVMLTLTLQLVHFYYFCICRRHIWGVLILHSEKFFTFVILH